jgi:protein-S-isoprenylcysteine O-methyltransferase Ste14
MTSVRIVWLLLSICCIGVEVYLARRTPRQHQEKSIASDNSERVLWLTLSTSLISALLIKSFALLPIPIPYIPRQLLAMVVVLGGLGLRYYAVNTLGRFFTTQVSIQSQHRLITDGPYRCIRHPAYTGLLITFAGAGVAMGDFLALLIVTGPVFLALNARVTIEEKVMQKKFGENYKIYQEKTKKFLPL